MSERHVIGGPWRLFCGLALAGVSGFLANLGSRLDWGMAWIAWVPAVVLLLPAFHLVRRVALVVDAGHLDIESGFFFRRAWRFALAEAELEIVPTAGLNVVILHKRGREIPLASWVSRRRAEAICAFIESNAGTTIPRRASRKPEADR